ncbi:MAG: hypothetical protein A2676_06160 [Candidatus Sungbacteria bacterium RIFCSPHIGHO2_01_FULL_51_22]|uniref:Uncharacterized protein n=1 Tax=Candidatus Sungbacteria bacterium RIFCSPHIGHO2_02_FULL_51_29 TaxID=1802273 RepID=A0A1G2KRH0_9BACT|nr:MAG: hypothetical protein A2676_06160 [Candidatus Sungbacteria bacterium RIFCSPHIGHO2_01_FULL_51_22]OHA02025.1 MAG: hypothetical protein A3C16_05715 [Candidatus Sungbacteria bacterium RIFCSPHIGHO2_02_FULL_51_29]
MTQNALIAQNAGVRWFTNRETVSLVGVAGISGITDAAVGFRIVPVTAKPDQGLVTANVTIAERATTTPPTTSGSTT